jgi:hypothetical protein
MIYDGVFYNFIYAYTLKIFIFKVLKMKCKSEYKGKIQKIKHEERNMKRNTF